MTTKPITTDIEIEPDFDVKLRLTTKQEIAFRKFLASTKVARLESPVTAVAVNRVYRQLLNAAR